MLSFLRLFNNPFAGPDGGDGGNGGHVIFQADKSVKCLGHVSSLSRAPKGAFGRSKSRHGANAEHLYIKVPVGTRFVRAVDGKTWCDFGRDGAVFIAARGGAGGRGNEFFLSNDVRAPMRADAGAEGEMIVYDLELRIIAHAGLVGFPNAGKSTLLRAVSRAKPRVAAYPFTTLNAHIGIVEYADRQQLAVADIPGLVKGARNNEGLGYSFLRHVERCLCLFYVIDLSFGDPFEQLDDLRIELDAYSPGLSLRPCAIVANKIDRQSSKLNLATVADRTDLPIFPVSAKYRDGLTPLLKYFRHLYDTNKPVWYGLQE